MTNRPTPQVTLVFLKQFESDSADWHKCVFFALSKYYLIAFWKQRLHIVVLLRPPAFYNRINCVDVFVTLCMYWPGVWLWSFKQKSVIDEIKVECENYSLDAESDLPIGSFNDKKEDEV